MTADQPVTDADLDAYFADHPELVLRLTPDEVAQVDEALDGPTRPVEPICGTLGAPDGRTTAEWPFGAKSAAHLVARVAWPNDSRIDKWSPRLVDEPEIRDLTIARARVSFEQAIAALADPEPAQVQQADEAQCDGSDFCKATVHVHGCYSDIWGAACDNPSGHEVSPS